MWNTWWRNLLRVGAGLGRLGSHRRCQRRHSGERAPIIVTEWEDAASPRFLAVDRLVGRVVGP